MFSEVDFQKRINAVVANIADAKLEALIVLDDDRWMEGGNVRYLTNYYHLFDTMPMGLIITPFEVTLCVIPGLGGGAFAVARQQCPWIKNVIGSRLGLWGSNIGKDIKSALEKAKIRSGKIGIDGLSMIPEPLCKVIRDELKDYSLVENTRIVEKMRVLKSPEEFNAIREAVRLTDIGVNAFLDSIKSGEPQYIAITKAEHAARLKGAEDVLVFMGVGKPWIWGQYPGSRIYQKGDMISFEFNARYMGYWGQVVRTCIIGKPTDKQKEVYQVAFDSYKAMEAVIKPGITASELYKSGAEVLIKAGFEKPPRSGHGMGLIIAEGFDLDENDHTEMRQGTYLMAHTMVTIVDQGICAGIGNPALITDNSYELMSKVDYRIQV